MTQKEKDLFFWGLDLEMEQPSQEIISVGICFAFNLGDPFREYMITKNFLVTPSESVSDKISALTGLKDSDFDWKKSRYVCFQEIFAHLEGPMSHGISMFPEAVTWGAGDVPLLRAQMFDEIGKVPAILGRRPLDVKTLCMMDRVYSNKSISSKLSLRTALSSYGLSFVGNAHCSADDAENTIFLFSEIVKRKKKQQNLLSQIQELKLS